MQISEISDANLKRFQDSGVSISSIEGRGRCAIAARDFAQGELVMEFDSLATSLGGENCNVICHFCLQRLEKRNRCSRCMQSYYCSQQCQKRDWPLHKHECKIYEKLTPRILPSTLKLAIKCLVLLDRKIHVDSLDVDLFTSLRTVEMNDENKTELATMAGGLSSIINDQDPSLPRSIIRILSVFRTNAFVLTDEYLDPIGSVIAPRSAMLNHSCCPNVFVQFLGRKCSIRCLVDIAKGTEMCNSYCQLYQTRNERQKYLYESYGFECDCERCSSGDDEHVNTKLFEEQSRLVVSYIDSQNFKEAAGIAELIVKMLSTTLAKTDPVLGIAIFRLAKTWWIMEDNKALAAAVSAEQILSISHGKGHPLMRQVTDLRIQAEARARFRAGQQGFKQ